jgi:hypothetical protein
VAIPPEEAALDAREAPAPEALEVAAAPAPETVEELVAPVSEVFQEPAVPVSEVVQELAAPGSEVVQELAAPVSDELEHPAFDELASTPRSELGSSPDSVEPWDSPVSAPGAVTYSGFDTADEVDHAEVADFAPFDPMAFDEGAEGFVVQSLEPEPISFESFGAPAADEVVEAVGDPFGVQLADAADVDFAAGAAHEVIESVDNYLVDEPEPGNDEPWTGSVAPPAELVAPEAASVSDAAAAPPGELAEQRGELDPWEGAELPEPAFGSIGWPSNDLADPSAEAPVEAVDEMSAALAWSEMDTTDAADDQASYTAAANDAEVSGDEALSGMASELRDSSSAWAVDGRGSTIDDEADVNARARFFGGGDASGLPPSAPAGPYDQSGYEAGLESVESAESALLEEEDHDGEQGDQGAAIADALGRVAARIRAGEVDLPSEVVGASDESALAAALAALLRGPRR